MPRLVKKKKAADDSFLPNARRIGELADKIKAIDIKAYDVRGLTLVADAFVICSASSEPQLKAIANSVREGMKEIGVPPLHTEGTFHGGWMVLDYGDVIVHLFREEAREYYDLDGLWADAPEIELNLAS